LIDQSVSRLKKGYDPTELQGAGKVQSPTDAGPWLPDILQFPKTASSGLKETCTNSGWEYRFFTFSYFWFLFMGVLSIIHSTVHFKPD